MTLKYDQGLSLMALSATDEVIGVSINGAITRENNKTDLMIDEVNSCKNQKFKKILNLLTTVNIESDIFGRFPEINSLVEIRVLSVDDAYRGQGIAKALIDRTRLLAKQRGYDVLKVDCTSHYSACAVSRLGGYECIYTLKYADHLDDNGDAVFEPEPPHSLVKTYIYRLK